MRDPFDENGDPRKPGPLLRGFNYVGLFLLSLLFGTARLLCFFGRHRYQRTNRTSLPERCCVRCNQHQVRVGINDDMWITRSHK